MNPGSKQKQATIVYTNWKGKVSTRTIEPQKIWFGHNQWHPKDQWLMDAIDLDKNSTRCFTLKDISKWEALD